MNDKNYWFLRPAFYIPFFIVGFIFCVLPCLVTIAFGFISITNDWMLSILAAVAVLLVVYFVLDLAIKFDMKRVGDRE